MKKIKALLIVAVVVLVFRKLVLPGPAVWGDAPYFFSTSVKELLALPSTWIARGNTFGGVNLFLWIYPVMVVYGALGTVLHLSNDLIIRIMFYFPSLVFGVLGVWSLTDYLKLSKTVGFFAALFYLVNTYYVLLVDGGQVGVVLAYGLFPLTVFFIVKLIDEASVRNFLTALVVSFVLTIVDFRIAAICITTAVLWKMVEWRKLKAVVFLVLALIGLSLYWIIPSLKLAGNVIDANVSGLQLMSLLNSLLLFSPNWPANEFGKVVAPYFYFIGVPFLLFLPLFVVKKRKIVWISLVFLIFAFLAKGETPPVGFFYHLLVNTKIGVIFRDSTKFFIPLMLLGGILLGETVEFVNKKIFSGAVFLYVLLLVNQAVFGNLNGVLGKNIDISDFEKIRNEIVSQDGFLRSAWFTERSPFAYHTENKQALDAKDLASFRPFARMNVGTSDRFNFMNNGQYLEWFNLFGIKYLVFAGNPRTTQPTDEERKDWDRLLGLLDGDKKLQRLDIGTSFPLYKNPDIKPHGFFVDKTFVVVGGDDVYDKLAKLDKNFSVGNQGFLFAEDGKLDPASLQKVASTSAILIFNAKNQDDFKMSFLQKYFVAASQSVRSDWAVYSKSDYLKYKYELLIRKIDFKDFDYDRGIAFSTKSGEKMVFKLTVPVDGDYILALRKMDEVDKKMQWSFEERDNLRKGNLDYVIENKSDMEIVNVVGLIPKNEMNRADNLAKDVSSYFSHFDLANPSDEVSVQQILSSDKWENIKDGQITRPGWIIYTDSYNGNFKSYPFYSAINGFWVDPKAGDMKITFGGDQFLKWGIYLSLGSLLIITAAIIYVSGKGKKR